MMPNEDGVPMEEDASGRITGKKRVSVLCNTESVQTVPPPLQTHTAQRSIQRMVVSVPRLNGNAR